MDIVKVESLGKYAGAGLTFVMNTLSGRVGCAEGDDVGEDCVGD